MKLVAGEEERDTQEKSLPLLVPMVIFSTEKPKKTKVLVCIRSWPTQRRCVASRGAEALLLEMLYVVGKRPQSPESVNTLNLLSEEHFVLKT